MTEIESLLSACSESTEEKLLECTTKLEDEKMIIVYR